MNPETAGNRNPAAANILAEATRDRAEVMNGIIDQLQATLDGYGSVVDAINDGREDSQEIVEGLDEEGFARELEAWLTDEKLDYISDQMKEDPELEFTLSAVPVANFENSWDLIKTAKKLEKDGQRKVLFDNRAYKGYKPEELIGAGRDTGDSPISFSLTPNKVESTEGDYLPRKFPHRFLRERNVFDTIGFWFRLDAAGASLLNLPSGEQRKDTKSHGGPGRSTSWEGMYMNPATGRGKDMHTHPRLFVTKSDESGELVFVDYEGTGRGLAKTGPIVVT